MYQVRSRFINSVTTIVLTPLSFIFKLNTIPHSTVSLFTAEEGPSRELKYYVFVCGFYMSCNHICLFESWVAVYLLKLKFGVLEKKWQTIRYIICIHRIASKKCIYNNIFENNCFYVCCRQRRQRLEHVHRQAAVMVHARQHARPAQRGGHSTWLYRRSPLGPGQASAQLLRKWRATSKLSYILTTVEQWTLGYFGRGLVKVTFNIFLEYYQENGLLTDSNTYQAATCISFPNFLCNGIRFLLL